MPQGIVVKSQFPQPYYVPGIKDQAWRSDGFSAYASAPLRLSRTSGLTISGWVALESYPSDREVPVDRLKPASFFHQASASKGFDIFIDTFGRWGFRVSTDRGALVIHAPRSFPLGRWVQIAAIYDPTSGTGSLYLDGTLQDRQSLRSIAAFQPADTALQIARSWRDATASGFRLNGLSAAFDEITIWDHPVAPDAILGSATATARPAASASLIVPVTRFAHDRDRPIYHAMPPANWTNEPHGLVRRGRWWHLFYQRAPNGPFKAQMHWGHMRSLDLVHWTHMPDALWPSLDSDGADMKGIWSGSVVLPPRGPAYAFYTSVNHGGRFNPGISMAKSDDEDLRTWRKMGPILDSQGLRDFRDPFLWWDAGGWHMLIGASLADGTGGLAYYQCSAIADPHCWRRRQAIAPFAQMDVGSQIWEMPVFHSIGRGRHILLVNPIGDRVSKNGDPATRALYWIGTWDGSRFCPDDVRPKALDLLPGHLSPTVSRDADGRLLAIGIVDERRTMDAQRAAGWAHVFSLPREWYLLKDGSTLGQRPLAALSSLREMGGAIAMRLVDFEGRRIIGNLGRSFEAIVDFGRRRPTGRYGIWIGGSPDDGNRIEIRYDPDRQTIMLERHGAAARAYEGPAQLVGAYDVKAFGSPRQWHVFADHSVADIFINGAAAFSFRLYAGQDAGIRFGVSSTSPARATTAAWPLKPAKVRYDLEPSSAAPAR